MSRIGKQPIPVPSGVTVTVQGSEVSAKGSAGALAITVHRNMTVSMEDNVIQVTRPDDKRENRALHGLTRSLINNMVNGVAKPYEKKLEIVGVGYNARVEGNKLTLQVGFANKIVLEVPQGIACTLPDATHVVITGADKQAVGQFTAEIRRVRPPEPYKGKGIRYQNEHIRRKAGKAFGSK
jgi:large subunit ribosomal protein L6